MKIFRDKKPRNSEIESPKGVAPTKLIQRGNSFDRKKKKEKRRKKMFIALISSCINVFFSVLPKRAEMKIDGKMVDAINLR